MPTRYGFWTQDNPFAGNPQKLKILYHATTPSKAAKYRDSGKIMRPVRGFTTFVGALAWAVKVGRTVIYEIAGPPEYYHKMSSHHSCFGTAWWFDCDIDDFVCVFSAEKDA